MHPILLTSLLTAVIALAAVALVFAEVVFLNWLIRKVGLWPVASIFGAALVAVIFWGVYVNVVAPV